jgi:cytochrome c553
MSALLASNRNRKGGNNKAEFLGEWLRLFFLFINSPRKENASAERSIFPMATTAKKYHRKWRDIIRSLVLCRDGYKCYFCSFQSLSNHIHHINGNSQDNAPANLVTLCVVCHARFGSNGFRWADTIPPPISPLAEFFNTQIVEAVRIADAEIINKR